MGGQYVGERSCMSNVFAALVLGVAMHKDRDHGSEAKLILWRLISKVLLADFFFPLCFHRRSPRQGLC